MSQVKNVGLNEMRKSKKFKEFIDFHQTDDSSHVVEGLESEKLTFFKILTKNTEMSQVKNVG